MEYKTYNGWYWIENNNAIDNKESLINNRFTTTGKYLFFSDNKNELIELSKQILSEYNLFKAKVPESNTPNKSDGFGFVLCVYDCKNRYASELKTYETNTISYRYWKSDNATRKHKYSKQYLRS